MKITQPALIAGLALLASNSQAADRNVEIHCPEEANYCSQSGETLTDFMGIDILYRRAAVYDDRTDHFLAGSDGRHIDEATELRFPLRPDGTPFDDYEIGYDNNSILRIWVRDGDRRRSIVFNVETREWIYESDMLGELRSLGDNITGDIVAVGLRKVLYKTRSPGVVGIVNNPTTNPTWEPLIGPDGGQNRSANSTGECVTDDDTAVLSLLSDTGQKFWYSKLGTGIWTDWGSTNASSEVSWPHRHECEVAGGQLYLGYYAGNQQWLKYGDVDFRTPTDIHTLTPQYIVAGSNIWDLDQNVVYYRDGARIAVRDSGDQVFFMGSGNSLEVYQRSALAGSPLSDSFLSGTQPPAGTNIPDIDGQGGGTANNNSNSTVLDGNQSNGNVDGTGNGNNSGSSSGGGGGCSLRSGNGPMDPILPMLMLAALAFLWRRPKRA